MNKSDFLPNEMISQEKQLEMLYPVYITNKGVLGQHTMMKLKEIDPKKYKWLANGIFTLCDYL